MWKYPQKPEEGSPDLLQLDLQAVESHSIKLLGSEVGLFVRAVHMVNHWTIASALTFKNVKQVFESFSDHLFR